MFYILAAVVTAAVVYAINKHITVAQAKAEAEAIVAKVKAEIAVVSTDATTVVAKIKAILTAVK
jgi:hypothetical protein